MTENDIIEMFEKGNSKKHIINRIEKEMKYNKKDSLKLYELTLKKWWAKY